MPATPDYESILEAIKTILTGITIAGGYSTDVGNVTRKPELWETIKLDGLFPWICVTRALGMSSPRVLENTVYRSLLDVQIDVMMRFDLTTSAVPDTAMNALQNDIHRILFARRSEIHAVRGIAPHFGNEPMISNDRVDKAIIYPEMIILMSVAYMLPVQGYI